MHTKQILLIICLISLIGIVSATVPSIPHAFRGTAEYSDGEIIPDGYIVTAKLDDQPINTSSVIKDGKYGYEDSLLVSDIIGNGEKVYFYINGKLVENDPINFIIEGFTELNLTTNLTNPNSLNESNNSSDNSTNKKKSSSGGGGFSGSMDNVIKLDYKTGGSLEGLDFINVNEETNAEITGSVIGFMTSGKVAIIFINLIAILIVLMVIKKYK